MGDWVIRPYESDDEACCVSMWLRSYALTSDIREWLEQRHKPGDMGHEWYDDELAEAPLSEDSESWKQRRYYWGFHRPLVVSLLRGAETRVLCDPERAHGTSGEPACIWAWACVSPGLVHYVSVKQDVVRLDREGGDTMALEMVGDLLSDKLGAPQACTWQQRELRRLGLLPSSWTFDGRWLRAMRQVRTVASKYNHALDAATRLVLDSIGAERA